MLEFSHRGWKTERNRNDGLFPVSKRASLVDYLRSSREEKLWVRAAVLLCAFGSTSLHLSGLAWDLEWLEVKAVRCDIASHLHSKIFMYIPKTTEEIEKSWNFLLYVEP